MVDLNLKPDPLQPSWLSSEEIKHINGIHWRISSRPHTWRPPTDLYETDSTLVVRIEIAGMKETDFSISLVERSLTIKGTRSDISERRAYHQMEIPFGEFSTEVELPYHVIADEVEAVYREGFLNITLPKTRPQNIKVDY
jgi:HSP20 family protein